MTNSWQGLRSEDTDAAARAAAALFDSGAAEQTLANPEAAQSLEQGVAGGARSAAAILLLAYTPGGGALLHKLFKEHGSDPVKLRDWSRPVPLRLAANVALSRRGDRDARRRLAEEIGGYPTAERVFLLDVMPYIDAPELWGQMIGYFADESEIPEGVPAGAARRRVCDYALDAFAKRIPLQLSFPLEPSGRYKQEQIEEARNAFEQRVPH
jgi:hypothetical protein